MVKVYLVYAPNLETDEQEHFCKMGLSIISETL